MKVKPSVLLFSFFLIGMVSLALSVNAQTTTESATYRDWIFHNLSSNHHLFFSSRFMNESKYFAILTNAPNMRFYRFSTSGALEDEMQIDIVQDVGNDLMIWGNDTIIFAFTKSIPYNQVSGLKLLNMTKYINGSNPLSDVFTFTTSSSLDSELMSVSPAMTKEAYPSGTLDYNHTLALVYGSTIYYDFYDLDTGATKTPKSMTWTTGISDLNKTYVIGSEGNCFYYDDCVFHIIYEGRTVQNDNRYGIYVREARKGTFGWDFKDKGLIGYDSALGFYFQTSGIDYWFMTFHYPCLTYKIYQRVLPSRYIVYDLFTPTWTFVQEGRINTPESNAFSIVEPQKAPINSTSEGCPSHKYEYDNVFTGNSSYLYFYTRNYYYASSKSYKAKIRVNVTYENTSSYHNITKDFGTVTGFDYKLIGRVPVQDNKIVNVTIELWVKWYNSTYEGCEEYPNYTEAYLDIMPNIEMFLSYGGGDFVNHYSGTPKFFITSAVETEAEAFSIFYYSGINDFYNMGNFGIQTLQEACVCNPWQFAGCYNSSHSRYTRLCSPPLCADEFKYVLNETCGVTPTTTLPQIPPGYGEPVFNETEWEETGLPTWILPLLTPFSIMTFVMLGIAAYITKMVTQGSNINAGLVFGIVVMIMLLIYGILGIYPSWLVILFIIAIGLLIAKTLTGVFGG